MSIFVMQLKLCNKLNYYKNEQPSYGAVIKIFFST